MKSYLGILKSLRASLFNAHRMHMYSLGLMKRRLGHVKPLRAVLDPQLVSFVVLSRVYEVSFGVLMPLRGLFTSR